MADVSLTPLSTRDARVASGLDDAAGFTEA
jgi:hypothetical protein